MKNVILCIVATIIFASHAFAATKSTLTGKVSDEKGSAVAYSTVVVLKDNVQVAGTTTDDKGVFKLLLDDGTYSLLIEFLGHEPDKRTINISGATDIGTVTLRQSSVEIEGVAVTAQVIKREADRFVVDVSNMTSALGKDGIELLEAAPAVFIHDDQISINGKSGTKVYINDREFKYSSKEQLISYLRSLKSENIRTIEVIPQSGADYDADSTGGIIKITLKRRRDDGIMGLVAFSTRQSDLIHSYVPTASINYHSGKWTLTAAGWYSGSDETRYIKEDTEYFVGSKQLSANSENGYKSYWYGANIGAILDINDRHSIGAEVDYLDGSNKAPTISDTHLAADNMVIDNHSDYRTRSNNRSVTATLNYIIKLDSLGSQLKILADYNYYSSHSNNNYITTKKYLQEDLLLHSMDSLYRDRSATDYNVTTLNIGYEKFFSPMVNLKAGAKYTNNIMASNATYHYRNEQEQWINRDGYGYDEHYTEHIAAAYITASAQLGRWSLIGGLRGEYTHTSGRGNVAHQNYFSLFPNANVSYALTKDQSYSMVMQYARSITRPNFWALNPQRLQISDYSYQCGNPYLRPQYANDISLTFVLKYKYSITLGAILRTDEIQQMTKNDITNPDINYIINENLHSTQNYYLSASLPFQLTKWWTLNLNATAIYNGVRIDNSSPQRFHFMYNGNVQTTFHLPKKFFIDLSYYGMSNQYVANIVAHSTHRLNITLKKRLLKNTLTLSAGVRNIIPLKQTFTASTDAMKRTLCYRQPWSQPTFVFSASWMFNKGKEFIQKSIERGADSSRLSK